MTRLLLIAVLLLLIAWAFWKVVDGVAQEQIVETSRRGEEAVEIASGLALGDVILLRAAEGKVARIERANATSVAKPVALTPDVPGGE